MMVPVRSANLVVRSAQAHITNFKLSHAYSPSATTRCRSPQLQRICRRLLSRTSPFRAPAARPVLNISYNATWTIFKPVHETAAKQDQPTLKTVQHLPNVWLRDNCRCSQCINQETMQKNFRVFEDLPLRPLSLFQSKSEVAAKMAPCATPGKVTAGDDGVKIIWDHEKHESFYTWDFLMPYLDYPMRRPRPETKALLWGSDISQNAPTVVYKEVMDTATTAGMAKLTNLIMRHGFVFVDGTPFDNAVHTKSLLERIGPIRETHYGGFYDFIPDMAKADTAYSNIALPAHTDTTYFTEPAGLQAFHLLSHKAPPDAPEGDSATGGQSLLVDGFHAAEVLRKEDPDSFKVLSENGVYWHASGNEGVTITPEDPTPVIETRKAGSEVVRIRWNNDDRGVLPLAGDSGSFPVHAWYAAATKWNDILKRSSSEFWFQLTPGRVVIFDNHRVMHGRSAFTGLRRICGAYINKDDFMSRWRNTNLSRDEVQAQVVG